MAGQQNKVANALSRCVSLLIALGLEIIEVECLKDLSSLDEHFHVTWECFCFKMDTYSKAIGYIHAGLCGG